MATQLQLRRGTTAENNSFTGAQGEVTMDTDTNGLRIHDGTTMGGHKVEDLSIPNYALGQQVALTGITQWEAPIDCFVSYQSGLKNGAQEVLYIGSVRIFLAEGGGSVWQRSSYGFYMKAGQILTGLAANDANRDSTIYYFPLGV